MRFAISLRSSILVRSIITQTDYVIANVIAITPALLCIGEQSVIRSQPAEVCILLIQEVSQSAVAAQSCDRDIVMFQCYSVRYRNN